MTLLLFLILESLSMIIVLICCKNIHDNDTFKECYWLLICSNSFILYWKKTSQEILYTAMLDYLLRYIRSKSGRKLVLVATVVYSSDLNLRTSHFSIVSFRLYA